MSSPAIFLTENVLSIKDTPLPIAFFLLVTFLNPKQNGNLYKLCIYDEH